MKQPQAQQQQQQRAITLFIRFDGTIYYIPSSHLLFFVFVSR